jgi:hypothetical protein
LETLDCARDILEDPCHVFYLLGLFEFVLEAVKLELKIFNAILPGERLQVGAHLHLGPRNVPLLSQFNCFGARTLGFQIQLDCLAGESLIENL